MEQICNLVYFSLTENKTPAQIAELNVLLSDPRDREKMLERQNALAMEQLGGLGMVGPPPGGPTRQAQAPKGRAKP